MTKKVARSSTKRSEASTPANGTSPTGSCSKQENKRPTLSSPASSSRSRKSSASTPCSEKTASFLAGQLSSAPGTPSSPSAKRRWSKAEDEKLCAAVKGVGLHDWKTIADVYMAGHELSDAQCMHRWQKVLRPGLVKGAFCEKEDKVMVECLREGGLKRRWTKQEDEKLCLAVKAVGTNDWKQIAEFHLAGHGRSDVQCLHRWQKVLRAGLVKGAFTEEEDKIIIECMREGGLTWMQIAERIPGRIGKQCRERWTNHLDPNLKKGGWTHEEDTILAEAQQRWGNAWTKIAKLLPGRAENAVKNRWNSAFRRKKSAMFGKVGPETPPGSLAGEAEGTPLPTPENTAAIAKARAAMELLDRDEKESSVTSSSSSCEHRNNAGSSSSSKGKGSRGGGGGGKRSASRDKTHAGLLLSSFGVLPGGVVPGGGGPTTRVVGGLFDAAATSDSASSDRERGPLPALRLPTSAFSAAVDGECPSSSSAGAAQLNGIVLDLSQEDSSSSALDLFGDYHNDMDVLSLDGGADGDDDDDHCDLSLDNLDMVEARFAESAAGVQGRDGGPPRIRLGRLGHHHHQRGEPRKSSFDTVVDSLSGGGGGGGGDHHHGRRHDDDDRDHDDDDDDAAAHDHRPQPLALSRDPLPNCCPGDDDLFYAGRTGLTPNGPMTKTPSSMMDGLSPTNGLPSSFSPFADCEVVHVLDPDDLEIDICDDGLSSARIDHDFMSPNGHEYHAAWGLPAPEVRLPTKVSELLSSSKPHPLLRNLSTATDVTVITSPTNTFSPLAGLLDSAADGPPAPRLGE